jgi:hypothetical protein
MARHFITSVFLEEQLVSPWPQGVLLRFTKFGQTGLTVSRMIPGTGTFGKQPDENEASFITGHILNVDGGHSAA